MAPSQSSGVAKGRGTLSSAGAVGIVARPKIVRAAVAAEIIATSKIIHAGGRSQNNPAIQDSPCGRQANVVDEEDATDVADPLRVSIRIYRVCNVGSAASAPPSKKSGMAGAVSRAGQAAGELPSTSSP